jgi:hypothetical protein
MAKHGPNVWVVRLRRGFSVKEEGNPKYLIPPASQRSAISVARMLARNNRSELIVQSRSGRIRSKDSHGSDPFPPKG